MDYRKIHDFAVAGPNDTSLLACNHELTQEPNDDARIPPVLSKDAYSDEFFGTQPAR